MNHNVKMLAGCFLGLSNPFLCCPSFPSCPYLLTHEHTVSPTLLLGLMRIMTVSANYPPPPPVKSIKLTMAGVGIFVRLLICTIHLLVFMKINPMLVNFALLWINTGLIHPGLILWLSVSVQGLSALLLWAWAKSYLTSERPTIRAEASQPQETFSGVCPQWLTSSHSAPLLLFQPLSKVYILYYFELWPKQINHLSHNVNRHTQWKIKWVDYGTVVVLYHAAMSAREP